LARVLVAEAAAVFLLVLTLTTWFAGAPRWLSPILPAAAFVGVVWWRYGSPLRDAIHLGRLRPRSETAICLLLALAYRLHAVLHPWGFVNRDGAFGAFIAMHLLGGVRPAPIFTEGANYQGSLKGHLAALLALLTRSDDYAWLMLLASLVLYLVFVAASMALARRLGGPVAASVTGLYLALSPKFLTTFSLNCVGQYVDVLALGGSALVVLASLLEGARTGQSARNHYFGLGILLGAAFWQQPVALAYVGAAAVALGLRRATWRDPWSVLAPLGLAVGALPVLLWNLQNAWGSGDILGRDSHDLLAQAEALPVLVARTLAKAFPVLAGLSPGHPASEWPGVRAFAVALLPLAGLSYLFLNRHSVREGLRGRASASLLPLLLAASTLVLFWATASGSINKRPRYLLPALAALAVMLGVVAAWAWVRARMVTALTLAATFAFNVSGTLPRLRESAAVEAFWAEAVRSLEEKQIRTGYSDFSVAAPVTMFTAGRIILSARLGPTPAYHSDLHDQTVARDGPDAYVLPRGDDPAAFAAALRAIGATCRYEAKPFPTFWGCSRRVRLDEVIGFRGEESQSASEEE
jgi:hypothetical protein